MRRGGAFETETLPPEYRTRQSEATTVGWKSPVPYLFGGLAAMLGLIAFALLILACSYWKLSGVVDETSNDNNNREGDGKLSDDNDKEKMMSVMADSVLVIMAGDAKPTFLAMPVESRDSSGGCGGGGDEKGGVVELDGCTNKQLVELISNSSS